MRALTRLDKSPDEYSHIFYYISSWIFSLSSSQISPLRHALLRYTVKKESFLSKKCQSFLICESGVLHAETNVYILTVLTTKILLFQ